MICKTSSKRVKQSVCQLQFSVNTPWLVKSKYYGNCQRDSLWYVKEKPVWPSWEFCGLFKIPFDKSLKMFVMCEKQHLSMMGFSGWSFIKPVSVPLFTVI